MKIIFTRTLFFVFAIFLSYGLQAQIICGEDRYYEEVFASTTMTTAKFGENTTFNGDFQELYMDIYEPTGDTETSRPVILVAFGGSFIAGSRSDVSGACERFARMGYVAAAIDYRLYDAPLFPFPDSIDMMDVVMKAMSDMKGAVRFLRKDADTDNLYGIDPDIVFVSGFSAGGIVATNTAYIDEDEVPPFLLTILNDNGGIEGNTDDPDNSSVGYSSEVNGVINFFGALYRRSFASPDDPPIISIHGTDDGTVPYQFGFANVFGLDIVALDGSWSIHQQADVEGIENHLITVPGGGHGDYMGDQMWADSIYDTSTRILADEYCIWISGIETENVSHQITAFPNPTTGNMRITFNGLGETYDFLVFDNLGRHVKALYDINSDEIVLNEQDFPAGFYHASIRFSNESLAPVNMKLVFGK